MKINGINSFKPAFGHISSRAVDAVRCHAEGYRVNNKTGEGFYSTNKKYGLMNSKELKRLENLVLRASKLDNSWIDYSAQDDSLVVDFYKDCNPWQSFGFNIKKEGNADNALDILEYAVEEAESGEYADIDESKMPSSIWKTNKNNTNHASERFRNLGDDKALKRIYDKTFDLKA